MILLASSFTLTLILTLTTQSISHDSELMTQYVAAKGFPDSSRPIAARDEYGRLLLFTFGTDSKFYVSKVDDGSGQRMLLNLGDMLDLKEDYVGHAMSVTQNPVSDKLYIVLAIARLGADTQSHLYLLRPFHPSEKDLGSHTTHLNDLIIPEHNEKFSRVHSIHMVCEFLACCQVE